MVNCFIGIMSGCMLMKRGIISGKTTITLLEQLAELVSDDWKSIYGNYQSAVYFISAKRHGTFFVGYTWGI